MTEHEWQEVEQKVREIAAQTGQQVVKKCISQLIPARQEVAKTRDRKKAQYEARKRFLITLFENYRQAQPGSWTRKTVDILITTHRDNADSDCWYKVRHNILVLRYVVTRPLTDKDICKRMGIRYNSFELALEKAFSELMVMYYGIEGIYPDEL